MHPDTPIRVLDEIIRRYGVTCVQLVPFEGGGYCVNIGSAVEPVEVGAGSLPEAIGKAFLELMRKLGRPSFDQLLELSSLGTPGAKALRESAPKDAMQSVVLRSKELERGLPATHFATYAPGPGRWGSACGRGREWSQDPDEVSCLRCRRSPFFKDAVRRKASAS
jgi:hypothetical protein